MTKAANSAIVLPTLAEIQAGKPVLASTWEEIIAAQHYIYGRQGHHVLNAVFDPEWVSLAYAGGGDAYHQVGTTTTGVMPLSRICALFRFDRLEYNNLAGAQGYRALLSVYARNLSVRATLTRLDTEGGHTGSSTAFTSLVTTHGASAWEEDAQEYTPSQASRGGNTANGRAYFLAHIEALVPSVDLGTTGQLYQVGLRIQPITAAINLPRGA